MAHTGLIRRGGSAAALAAVAVLVLGATPATAVDAAQLRNDGVVSSATVFDVSHRTRSGCTHIERYRSLALEQRRVLSFMKDFLVLRNEADVERLAQPRDGVQYFVFSHAYNSIRGMGLSIINGGEYTGPGKPAMLLYRPNGKAKNVTDPNGADFPYTLAGWGYAGMYMPGQPPSYPDDPGLSCLTKQDWLVHERSVHPADTWANIPAPPQEAWHGAAAGAIPPTAEECGCPVGMTHPRLWDLHLFASITGAATVSMLNPGRPMPGFDPQVGFGFFYPDQYPSATVPAGVDPHAGHHMHVGA
ncbi:hypothetical protein AB0K00_57415 [Dactylosporangium sp. NPDC049525]|uniref:hypothetical protein n=1 Tax=Dactylosporangium sp. NPDC049525 TaxID=3154730 RepID=UPI003427CAD2